MHNATYQQVYQQAYQSIRVPPQQLYQASSLYASSGGGGNGGESGAGSQAAGPDQVRQHSRPDKTVLCLYFIARLTAHHTACALWLPWQPFLEAMANSRYQECSLPTAAALRTFIAFMIVQLQTLCQALRLVTRSDRPLQRPLSTWTRLARI